MADFANLGNKLAAAMSPDDMQALTRNGRILQADKHGRFRACNNQELLDELKKIEPLPKLEFIEGFVKAFDDYLLNVISGPTQSNPILYKTWLKANAKLSTARTGLGVYARRDFSFIVALHRLGDIFRSFMSPVPDHTVRT
jgi:hypothetical protein